MLDLTFGEQVKIVLSRKGMTIKELAETIEAETGKKMSRQNLTQRLGRDNFQEQDMRMIAQILDCPFHLNILDEDNFTENTYNDIEEQQVLKNRQKVAKKKVAGKVMSVEEPIASVEEVYEEILPVEESCVEQPVYVEEQPVEEAYTGQPVYEEEPMIEEDYDDTASEVQEALEEIAALEEEARAAEQRREEAKKEEEKKETEKQEAEKKETGWFSSFRRRMKREDKRTQEASEQSKSQEVSEETFQHTAPEDVAADMEAESARESYTAAEDVEVGYGEALNKEEFADSGTFINELVQEAHAREDDWYPQAEEAYREEVASVPSDEEDLELGDVNPYTGREYETNSVRIHPTKIGYVQVYDRAQHAWSDMTEWAFLGYQEQKKALLGKDYEPPIYLD